MGDLLDALLQQLPAEKRPKQLRLLEIFNGKIYQVRGTNLEGLMSKDCFLFMSTSSCCCIIQTLRHVLFQVTSAST